MSEVRIRGRAVYKDSVNNFYPKFTVYSVQPFLQNIIESPDELEDVPVDEIVYEPLEQGLGSRTEIMYVRQDERTFLFKYRLTNITWGSHVVAFSDPIDFEGNVYQE